MIENQINNIRMLENYKIVKHNGFGTNNLLYIITLQNIYKKGIVNKGYLNISEYIKKLL